MCDYTWSCGRALIRFVLQHLGSWSIFRSRSGFLNVLQVVAATPELILHLVTASVEGVNVREEASQPMELAVRNVFDYTVGVIGTVV